MGASRQWRAAVDAGHGRQDIRAVRMALGERLLNRQSGSRRWVWLSEDPSIIEITLTTFSTSDQRLP